MSTVQDDQLDTFVRAIQSLKLYRRAELKSQSGQELIEELYVDPLPNEHVLRTMIQPHTTFLVGRKGTGKSTVFQRAQFELRKNAHVATAYVDIKSVFESSRVDPAAVQMVENSGGLPHEALERLWLNREFFLTVLRSIREELEKLLRGASLWAKIKNRQRFSSVADLFRELDELIASANLEQFENVLGLTQRDAARSSNWSVTKVENARFQVGAGQDGVSVKADVGASDENVVAGGLNISDSDLMLRVFDLRGMIAQLKVILAEADITSLYVFLDDFSELPEDAMRTVVDGLLAPLNNWSDELIKFKIAAYPGRIYFGGIDPSKADQVNLDIYNLYGSSDVVDMEDKSVEFTRRLIERRLRRFGAEDMGVFFDMKEDVWRQLFQASMANPRALGYILYFAYEAALIYGRKIGAGVIRDASRKYYEDKIQAGFEMNRFLNVSFSERSSLFGLRELLEMIVDRARELRRSSSPVIRDLEGRAPTSHFHVDPSMDQLLNTLELSFFITKYSSMRNKDGRKVSVYALNYGLCQQQKLEYGRPAGARDKRYRQYFVERIFDFTATVSSYIKRNQEIVCRACGAKHDLELLSAIRAFGMSCPTCRVGTCELINLSRKYEEELQTVEESSLLPAVELGILLALNAEQEPIGASEVAGELDCSYQLIGRRVKNLDERGLVDRDTHNAGRRRYIATDLARTVYFSEQTAPD